MKKLLLLFCLIIVLSICLGTWNKIPVDYAHAITGDDVLINSYDADDTRINVYVDFAEAMEEYYQTQWQLVFADGDILTFNTTNVYYKY